MRVEVRDTERFVLDAGHVNAAGFWHTAIRFARSGIQLYPATSHVVRHTAAAKANPNGMVRVLRDDSAVFDAESMASFEHVPITDDHNGGIVDAETATRYTFGMSKSPVVKVDGGGLKVPIVVLDAKLIEDAQSGKKSEGSAGYSADVLDESGVHEKYGEYDASMRDIRGNHIALVPRGRAGREFRIEDREETMTVKRTFNGVTVEFSEQGAQIIDSMQELLDEGGKRVDALDSQVNSLTAERDAKQAELDVANQRLSAENINALIKERKRVLDRAKELNTEFTPERKTDDGKTVLKSNKEIVKEIAQHVSTTPLDGKSDDYINAVFDFAVVPAESLPRVFDSKEKTELGIAETARAKFIKERSGR